MAEQRIDASLDAFDALIAGLAAAGEVADSEVDALRDQREVPRTGEIPIQADMRWAVRHPAAAPAPGPTPEASLPSPAPAATAAPAPSSAPSASQPLTRREARRLREAREAQEARQGQASVADAVERENARRTEELIHSHRVRPALAEAPEGPRTVAPPQIPAAFVRPKAEPSSRPRHRRPGRSLLAAVGALALVPSLLFVVPATADAPAAHPAVDGGGRTVEQILNIASDVKSPTVQNVDYVAAAIAGIVAREGGASAEVAAPAIVDALQQGGARAQIIETALSYIGTPYVFGGDSHTGIDCSGLTMEAYAAVGVTLAHYVPTQDAVGTRITQAEAKAGDLVVFDNEDHIGIYLGDNQVLAAPEPGRRVSIESVDLWRPIGIHFTRVLPAGQ
ncbi:MAG TPA: NlpC/P60 family protein [Gryllotalpicola sp.]